MIKQNQEDKWIWDTGATHHMSNDLKESINVDLVDNKSARSSKYLEYSIL